MISSVTVDETKGMLGTFAPQREIYVHTLEEETTPSGILARGIYSAKLKVWLIWAKSKKAYIYLLREIIHRQFLALVLSFYDVLLQFEDDDKRCYLELNYQFEIKSK